MLFSSFIFLFLFIPVVIIIYYLGGTKKWRNTVLLIFSLFFYAWGEPIYVFLMIASIIVSYGHTYLINRNEDRDTLRKAILISSIVLSLVPLFVFKYMDFMILNINTIFNGNIKLMGITLPIGISFFTFQILSYNIDVYMKRVEFQKNPVYLGTYVALFPQLIAGPIVKYIDVQKELNEDRNITFKQFMEGIIQFIYGLAKKVIIANNVALLADFIFTKSTNAEELGVLLAWTGALAYGIQIYFDFGGYSDMAIGLGKIFGFNFPKNFNYPYTASTITGFWRRWHMTLGTWFREYIYIPLGGNRVPTWRFVINILIIWSVTGLWHGASWNFVLWGAYFGAIMLIEKFFTYKFFTKHKWLGIPYTLIVVMIGWVLFRTENLTQAGHYLEQMFDLTNWGSLKPLKSVVSGIGPVLHVFNYVVVGIILSTPIYKITIEKLFKNDKNGLYKLNFELIVTTVLLILSIAFLSFNTYNPFIYFNF